MVWRQETREDRTRVPGVRVGRNGQVLNIL